MKLEKLLILESTWAQDEAAYLTDSRSTAQFYSNLLAIQQTPVFAITRPLLANRFQTDIKQFVSLPVNQRGPNVIILSGHGQHQLLLNQRTKKHRRILQAIDGEINLSLTVRTLSRYLQRTIFILDACDIGENIASFQQASGALGVIGFSNIVDWVDSSTFILALLLKFQQEGVFEMKRTTAIRPYQVLETMLNQGYQSLMDALAVNYYFK